MSFSPVLSASLYQSDVVLNLALESQINLTPTPPGYGPCTRKRVRHSRENSANRLGDFSPGRRPSAPARTRTPIGPMSDEAALEVALRLKALADPVRVKIMSLLFAAADGEENSRDLAAAIGVSESTASHHLTQLRNAGLVESTRRGMNVYHRPHGDAVAALCAVLDPDCCR